MSELHRETQQADKEGTGPMSTDAPADDSVASPGASIDLDDGRLAALGLGRARIPDVGENPLGFAIFILGTAAIATALALVFVSIVFAVAGAVWQRGTILWQPFRSLAILQMRSRRIGTIYPRVLLAD
jgi:hypothetical protein